MTLSDVSLPVSDRRPTLICLHWLGGSSRTWDKLAAALGAAFRVVTVDLPGFGDAAHRPGVSVAAMADHVVDAIRAEIVGDWVLAGHSMGAKVALAVARRAEDGEDGLAGLSHLVLLAGSPPAPEPMDEARRAEMLTWFASHPDQSRAEAQTLIDGNVGAPLDADSNAAVAADILRLNRQAWVAWLEDGSREDWADRIGVLQTPALIVAGEKDGDLGPAGQRRLMARHFADGAVVTLPGVGHLLPVERPEAIARLIVEHVARGRCDLIPPHYRTLIESDRVSARTRHVLLGRAATRTGGTACLSAEQSEVLRGLVDRVLPQPEPRIDIAEHLDRELRDGPGDGWRYADLPADRDSARLGLDTLQAEAERRHGRRFPALAPAEQDALLATLPEGKDAKQSAAPGRLAPHQMALWFEDMRAAIVRLYMAHPLALARIGYSGIGYGGDGEHLPGFAAVGLDQVEPWEPRPMEAAL